MFNKRIPREVLEVRGDPEAYLEEKLDELGAAGWELVTETPHVSEVEPPIFARLTAFDSTRKGRVRTDGYTPVFKRPLGMDVKGDVAIPGVTVHFPEKPADIT